MLEEVQAKLLKLPLDIRQDLLELVRLVAEEDVHSVRLRIAQQIAQVAFPETAEPIVDAQTAREIVATRQKLCSYRRTVGNQIRRRRQEMRLSQEQLAKAANVARSHVSRLESGRHMPIDSTIAKLAQAMGLTAAQLGLHELRPDSSQSVSGAA